VHAQVRFGQQHRGRDTARALRRGGKTMEQLAHRLQARSAHGVRAGAAQGGGIQQPFAGAAAAMEISGEVQSLHQPHCSASAAGPGAGTCLPPWKQALGRAPV